MKAALLCREMKWDWHTYRDQPQWFVEMLLSMMQNEAEQSRAKKP